MNFHDSLKIKMHLYVKQVYKVTKNFPRDELYGVTSQFRRAAMSVILNYIEGYARRKGNNCKVYKNFLEISYGSLRETKYLIYFSFSENYINQKNYNFLISQADELGKMIWTTIKSN
ncbi:MAG: four helix bundle protein [Patescibacteria group bacterium]|nr:four helix bundle protein [Patescibacteria group bacterium]MDD4610559.1 four helix bundle protein [Patescibacteria group bacterium]